NEVNRGLRNVVRAHNLFTEYMNAPGCNRTHRILRMRRHAELAHEEDVEGGIERFCNLEGHRHATAWQSQHDNIVATGVLSELRSQFHTGLAPVRKGPSRFTEHGQLLLSRAASASEPRLARTTGLLAADPEVARDALHSSRVARQ